MDIVFTTPIVVNEIAEVINESNFEFKDVKIIQIEDTGYIIEGNCQYFIFKCEQFASRSEKNRRFINNIYEFFISIRNAGMTMYEFNKKYCNFVNSYDNIIFTEFMFFWVYEHPIISSFEIREVKFEDEVFIKAIKYIDKVIYSANIGFISMDGHIFKGEVWETIFPRFAFHKANFIACQKSIQRMNNIFDFIWNISQTFQQ